jgi:hypothetical protein
VPCARFAAEGTVERTLPQVAVWIVLLIAVVVLTALTLRLARQEESTPPGRSA